MSEFPFILIRYYLGGLNQVVEMFSLMVAPRDDFCSTDSLWCGF